MTLYVNYIYIEYVPDQCLTNFFVEKYVTLKKIQCIIYLINKTKQKKTFIRSAFTHSSSESFAVSLISYCQYSISYITVSSYICIIIMQIRLEKTGFNFSI